MDNKDIVSGPVGSVGKYDVAFIGGQLVLSVDASMELGSAGVNVKIDAGKVLDALAKAIPGTIDDSVIALIKAGLLGK